MEKRKLQPTVSVTEHLFVARPVALEEALLTSIAKKLFTNNYPTKTIVLGGKQLTIHHLGESDPYFGEIRDDYGTDLQQFCRDNLTPESVVVDIGANIGLTSSIFSRHASHVHAFEPSPKVFPLLKENIKSNRLHNVTVHKLAIGAATGTVHFAGGSAFGYMSQDETNPKVNLDTLDNIVAKLGLSRLDLLKIDVEGYERDVLDGARETIKQFKPTIYMELNAWCMLYNARQNPCDFAEALYRDYGEILVMKPSGIPEPAPDSTNLVFQNFFTYGSVNDLILRQPRF